MKQPISDRDRAQRGALRLQRSGDKMRCVGRTRYCDSGQLFDPEKMQWHDTGPTSYERGGRPGFYCEHCVDVFAGVEFGEPTTDLAEVA